MLFFRSASAESTLADNLTFLEKAGYEVQFVNNRKIGNRIMLTSVPLSRQQTKIFDLKDIDELLFILTESSYTVTSTSSISGTNDDGTSSGGSMTMIKPSSLRAMYASKACRKSVMIGDPLNKFEMKRIVKHLSEIDKPWNCPHGRPTLRHLINLNLLKNV
jgi:DNA mismatch repair protein PMS2